MAKSRNILQGKLTFAACLSIWHSERAAGPLLDSLAANRLDRSDGFVPRFLTTFMKSRNMETKPLTPFQRQQKRNDAYYARRALGVEKLPNRETQGLDPREMPRTLLEKIGHTGGPLLSIIRAKCLDCSQNASEVRKCTAVDCSLWPYRMGSNPFRAERTEAQKAASAAAADRLRQSRA